MAERRSWEFLVGWLGFVIAWLMGGLAITPLQVWSWPVLICLAVSGICWGLDGWRSAAKAGRPREERAFLMAILTLTPWFSYSILILLPYAFGLRS